jgi:RNA polymerase sigma-70 factor (ECF subfamily)
MHTAMGSPDGSGRRSAGKRADELYREHFDVVARICRGLLRDRAEAEDAAQQVFLSAYRALLSGIVPREPVAWLAAIARNECLARLRASSPTSRVTREPIEGPSADTAVSAAQMSDVASLWAEVARLPPLQREAFLLREVRGLSYEQLATELEMSRPSVRSLLSRARSRLRGRLRDLAAALGSIPWAQAAAPTATKVAAVGGAVAITGLGTLRSEQPHRPRPAIRHAVRHRPPAAHVASPRARGPVTASAPIVPTQSRHRQRSSEGGKSDDQIPPTSSAHDGGPSTTLETKGPGEGGTLSEASSGDGGHGGDDVMTTTTGSGESGPTSSSEDGDGR